MRIFIDTTSTFLGQAGTRVYVHELLNALKKAQSKHEFIEFNCSVIHRRKKILLKKVQTAYRDIVWQNIIMPNILKKGHADLLHTPVLRTTMRQDVPLAITALDFYVLHQPKAFSRWASIYAKKLHGILVNAKTIISISEFTKNELLYFYPDILPEKIFVAPLGVSTKFKISSFEEKEFVRKKYNLDRPFLLCVNTLEPRKNLPAFLKAFEKVANDLKKDLVMIGGSGWIPKHENSVLKSMNNNPQIRYLGYVPDEDLAPLYSLSSFYVFPSFFEGFGLPLLEAMSCGCPVLSSSGSSLSEVAGDAALFMNPYDIDNMAEALIRINSINDNQRSELIEKGFLRCKNFSWDICAKKHIEAYEYATK